MRKVARYPLTYFTSRTIDELDTIIDDLRDTLSKEDIAKIFIDDFNAEKFYEQYQIAVTDKFIWGIKHTMKYAIDAEMLIRYIYSKFEDEAMQ